MELDQLVVAELRKNKNTGITAKDLSLKLNMPIKDVENILKKMFDSNIVSKTKADYYDKIKGRYGVVLYTLNQKNI